MDLFSFVAWLLFTVVVVTIAWPLNIPLMALAIKVRRGTGPIGYEPAELWWRCTFASLGLAVFALIVVGLSYGLIVEVGFDKPVRGPVHLVLLLALFAAGVPYVFWMLGLEDMVEAAGIYVLYVFLPGLPLFGLGCLLNLGDRVAPLAPWLTPATS